MQAGRAVRHYRGATSCISRTRDAGGLTTGTTAAAYARGLTTGTTITAYARGLATGTVVTTYARGLTTGTAITAYARGLATGTVITTYARGLTTGTTATAIAVSVVVGTGTTGAHIVIGTTGAHITGTGTTITGWGRRTIEVVATIVFIHREEPTVVTPTQGTEQEFETVIDTPLGCEEHTCQTGIAVFPEVAVDIGLNTALQEIIEINLIDAVVLRIGQVEFVGHLVGQVIGLTGSIVVTDGGCAGYGEHQRGEKCENPFHNTTIFFKVYKCDIANYFLLFDCKSAKKCAFYLFYV